MKRIGIVTLYGLMNYGNRLQNYALSRVLENNNCTVTSLCKNSKLSALKNNIKVMLLPFLKGERERRITRLSRFMGFQKYIETEYYSDKRSYDRYDCFITGSDQVWHPQWGGGDFYFLSFVRPEKRISYSASFGVSSVPGDKKEEYKTYLSEMKAISVREESGARIVKDLTGKDVPVLIDPTLLLDKEEWQKVSKRPDIHIPSKYLLTYFLGEISDERNRYLSRIAKENDLEIIRLEGHNPGEAWFKTGPSEFIWLIEHCSLMCTDSFHGSVFSMLMEVPFLVFNRVDIFGDMSSRIDTLLSKFYLESHRFNDQSGNDVFQNDYSHVQDILAAERQKALDYLNDALNDQM